MFINNTVIKYREIRDMLYKLYGYNNTFEYEKKNNYIKIQTEYDSLKGFLFGGYWVKIWVDNVLVYKDSYIHNIPKEMKLKINEEIESIKRFNKEHIRNSIYRKYNDMLKNNERQEKEQERQKFLKEQEYLIKKFK